MESGSLDIFRTRMKEVREKRGITLKELAEQVGCKEATMQRYESGNGIKNVPYDVIVTVSRCLEVSPSYLMGWEKPEPDHSEIFADIFGDKLLTKYIVKLKEMDQKDRKKVYDYIDFINYRKEIGG